MSLDTDTGALEKSPPLISAIEIDDLFNLHSYDIFASTTEAADGSPNRVILLYGSNGSGKTTLLNLVWHLLSPASTKAHRSFLARTPFKRLKVQFNNGESVEALKAENLQGPFSITVRRMKKKLLTVEYNVDEKLKAIPSIPDNYTLFDDNLLSPFEVRFEYIANFPRSARTKAHDGASDSDYRNYLSKLGVRPFFLADDRKIYSDDIDEEHERLKRGLQSQNPAESSRIAVGWEIKMAIRRVNDLFRQLLIRGQTSGSEGANTIYLDVIKRLAEPSDASINGETGSDRSESLRSRVFEIGQRTADFVELGLVPNFFADAFISHLNDMPDSRYQIAEGVLLPYLESLQARLDALQDAQTLIRTFLEQANSFLAGKRLAFREGSGIRIVTKDGDELDPVQLSSGERQLVLLLCNTLVAGTSSRLFIIDEPELSLNVKWQRKILEALLACTDGTGLQFLVATHSIEIISGARRSLVRLRPRARQDGEARGN